MSLPQTPLASRPTNRFRSRASLASAATLAAVAAPSLIHAQIVWSGALNTTVNSTTPTALLDFNQNSIADNPEAYFTFYSSKGVNSLTVPGITSSKTDPSTAFLYQDASVAFGSTINSSLSYTDQHFAGAIPANGNTYYYAFKYQASGGPYFGWMQITFSADSNTGTLSQWAYSSVSGASLTAGQTSAIPEPSAYAALFGLAAFGSAWWRKRRRTFRPA